MNKLTSFIIKAIFATVFSAILAVVLNSMLINNGAILFEADVITDPMTIAIFAIILLVFGIFALDKMSKSDGTSVGHKSVTTDGKELDQYYSSRLVTEKELKYEKKFMYSLYQDLKKYKRDGVIIRAHYKNKKLHVNMYKPIHTMIVGTTGSGKTTTYVSPTIQILSETASKPSMVISDPKGELYDAHAAKLLKMGYDVQVIDLREPDKSARWNPLERAYDFHQRAYHLTDEILVHKGASPQKFPNLQKMKSVKYGDEWYEFDNVAYPDKPTLKYAVTAMQAKLKSLAANEIEDIALTLCPVTGQDPMWSMGAQGFIKGILLAMLEDSLVPECGMTKDKFNFYNLEKIASRRDVNQNDTLETLKNYFAGRDKLSAAASGGNNVVQNAPNTAKGFLGHVNSVLKMFTDAGVCYLTSGTDIDLKNIANKPSAIFIKIPDETATRHPLANIYISQLYKILIELANERTELALPRNVYFVLDEFGNLPKIERIKSFVTAGRSRRIFLVIVVQSFTQLNSVYGEQDASTIKENCNIQVFIGTKDQKTKEEFSKNCGNVTVEVQNKSTSAQAGTRETSGSTSTTRSSNTVSRPLIYPEELDHLDRKEGEAIVNMFAEFSIKSKFTPTYLCPIYDMQRMPQEYRPSGFLNEAEVFYDVAHRNSVIFGNSEDGDDDFDFFKPTE
ncbi:MAG: type IV secretory system conjugative DNA transfer family protein [Spirochaetales bacterium]